MEYMRLDKFLGRQVSKILNKVLKEKVKFDPGIDISGLSFETTEDGRVELGLRVYMNQDAFEKVIEEVTR